MKCSQCGFENDPDAEYCEQCGAVLSKYCPQCGSPVKPGAIFCKKCGARVAHEQKPLENTQPPSGLQSIPASDTQAKSHAASPEMVDERKPVTILFTDIVNSTALSEKVDPEEWKEIVSGAHQRVSQAVYRYGGTIAQLLGDGVLAFFGAPVTHEDDPLRAVRAALDIQGSMPDYQRQLAGLVDDFQMRIGIHAGTVVVGQVGDDRHMEYLAVGDAVNLAARLQSAARPGGVLISEAVARQVHMVFDLQSLGEIPVKGKSEPVEVFEVQKEKFVPANPRGFEELYSPLVGRDREIGLLREALMALANGHGQIITILGEAGIGKSRLLEEAHRDSMNDKQPMIWVEGRALSYGQGLSFWIIKQLLYSDLHLTESDGEVRIRAVLKKRVGELFSERAASVLPYLLYLAGVRLESEQADRIKTLDGETLKHQILLTITGYFERLAQINPVVVVFEDLHWADPSSLEVLEQLMSLTDRVPLALFLVSRLERELPSWRIKQKAEAEFAHRYTEIQLQPLSSNHQNQLVDNLLALADLPETLRQLILSRSEGNPFYLEEIVRSLIDQGAIVFEGGSWRLAGELQGLFIPTTLQGVLLARIDRLNEDVRRTLQLASVIGKSFLYRILVAITQAEQQLDQHLALLQRVDLVREKNREPELEYIFKHSLTQEAAYNSLLLERRREFHQRVGLALEQMFAERKEQYVGLLAHHFEASGDTPRAIDYLIEAGDQARLTDEYPEAIGYYRRALNLVDELQNASRAAQIWFKLGLIYHADFQFEASHQAYEAAFRLLRNAPASPSISADTKLNTLRISLRYPFNTLDPGISNLFEDTIVILQLFSGLAKINDEMDVVPEIASSWRVMDDGRRYIFHLRDDFFWTDGSPVTAADFEWAWKRNLNPATQSSSFYTLLNIVGAQDYNQAIDPNPDHVGVRALDSHTLEVLLVQPAAYFPFIVTLPVALPLPRAAIEQCGSDWWKPGRMISNGAYHLAEFDPQHGCVLERSCEYPGGMQSNIGRIEWILFTDQAERIRAYRENRLDLIDMPTFLIPQDIPTQEIFPDRELQVTYLLFSSGSPPLDDPRVRQAFVHTLDRHRIYDLHNVPSANGGLVPPGMPGHSPDIGLQYNVELGQKLLEQAGYPGGRGFPTLTGVAPDRFVQYYADQYARQWHENLGIEVNFQVANNWILDDWKMNRIHGAFFIGGWLADFPDPDNFLHQSDMIKMLNILGWKDPVYDRLVEQAGMTSDRGKRLAMYRQADRILVHEQALIMPITYGLTQKSYLVKPWVKNFKRNLIGVSTYQNLSVEEH